MAINLHGQSLLTLLDLSHIEIEYLLNLSEDLKQKKRLGEESNQLAGKNVVLVFNKPSTRTRCAFETAIFTEGGHVTFLANSHMGHKESIEDTAKILGRYYDGIGFRGFEHKEAESLMRYSGIPVWNGLTDLYYPTQILADLLTISEYVKKSFHKIKCVYVGDGRNNVARSLMIGAVKMGMTLVNLAPEALWPSPDFLKEVNDINDNSHFNVRCTENIDRAVKDADIIYTDVWASMGEESEWSNRINLLKNYQVNVRMLDKTENDDVVFMHCLPAFHDTKTEVSKEIEKQFGLQSMEVTDEVFHSEHSLVFEQAENRLHTIKAVILATIGNI